MATSPRIQYPDGTGTTTELVLTTNSVSLNFLGLVDQNTIDVQIDVNGSGFVSDPTLVSVAPPKIRIPNPSSHPNGLHLDPGKNIIKVRSVDLNGSVSPTSTITVFVSKEIQPLSTFSPPTGMEIRRRAASVDILWSDVSTLGAVGYNVYASTGEGGTESGYLKVNQDMIPASSVKEVKLEEVPMLSFDYDFKEEDTGLEFQVQTQTADAVTGEVISKKSLTSWPLFTSPDFRFSGSIIRLDRTSFYLFNHDRSASVGEGILNNDSFSAVHIDDPLFYVVTAVYYDNSTGDMVESRFSREVAGGSLPLDTFVRGLRIRDQKRISDDYIGEVNRSDSKLSLIPGSTVREIHIEPFANEMQKAYFLMDFVHRAKSFAALLAIDDPTLSGTSVPVSDSIYKQQLKNALSIADDVSVQALIDGAFDSLAQNYGIKRQGSRAAVVNQTFYTTSTPIRDLVVQQNAIVSSSVNTLAPRFRAQGAATMLATNAQSYYNPDRRRYEITVQMVAETPGSDGNIPAGDLDSTVSGANGLQTINESSSDFGRDIQTNLELAEEASRALSSLDTGTGGGYERIAIRTPGVFEVRVVKSGDSLMMRDWDPIRKRHTGGKVDIYVKGLMERTIEETFAFRFSVAKNVRFDVIDPANLIFRARDSRLSPDNPIQEILNNESQGLGVRNQSRLPVASYDLTGYSIVDYRTIQLSTSIPQPETGFDDFVEGDYRYRSNNRFVMTVQPVRRIVSVVGEVSGALDPELGFGLYKTQDPLLEGESTSASDYVIVNQVNSVPSGDSIQVNEEEHVLIGEFEEPMGSVGINVLTLSVYSKDRSVLYNGPDSVSPDYFIIEGGQTKPIRIMRSAGSAIPSGGTVSVDYEHDENFKVTYVVNDVLHRLQSRIQKTRHTGADVLVKQSIENPMSTEATIQLTPNAIQSNVDSDIRTEHSLMTDRKGIGESIYQTDVSHVMSSTKGVSFAVQPFTKMTLKDGSLRVRESIPSNSTFLQSISRSTNAVYILNEPLEFATTDGGGSEFVHRGVYKDNLIMEAARSLEDVGAGPNRFWITGKNGAIIPGYSDDVTITGPFTDPDEVAEERLKRTANKVVISLQYDSIDPDLPSLHNFAATYVVSGDVGVKDIDASQVEYISPGDLTITYRKG